MIDDKVKRAIEILTQIHSLRQELMKLLKEKQSIGSDGFRITDYAQGVITTSNREEVKDG